MRRFQTRKAAVLLALALLLFLALPAAASAAAATMQLVKTEGTVSVSNASGRGLSVMDNMRLYNGYSVETKASSYAWVKLDGSKLVKLDAASKVEIRKSGSKLEILLKSGNVFFNVSAPLADSETLNVRTSTAIVGIRGTSGWVNVVDENTVELYILEGTVECTVTNPATGEAETVTVSSGEMARLITDPNRTGGSCEAVLDSFGPDDVQGFVLTDVLEDGALCREILERSGLDLQLLADGAADRLAADEAAVNGQLDETERRQSSQEGSVSTTPLWNMGGDADGTGADTVIDPAPAPAPELHLPPVQAPRPTPAPALAPAPTPTPAPGTAPGQAPSAEPSTAPSQAPSAEPSTAPSQAPSAEPSTAPSLDPAPSESS